MATVANNNAVPISTAVRRYAFALLPYLFAVQLLGRRAEGDGLPHR